MNDLYEVLGISRSAGSEEIKRAYRKKARQVHPDVAGPEGAEEFKELTEAYEILSDADKRSLYDRGVDPRSRGGQSGGFESAFDLGDIFNIFAGGGAGG